MGLVRTVLHCDINSYFATLLQQQYRELRGKPLVVVKELGRTCVIAASKEAKLLGVKTGSNLYQAKQLVPNLMVRAAEFPLYLSATKKLAKLFQEVVPDVIIYSLDEAFLELTNCGRLYADPVATAHYLQHQIAQQLGEVVTANVGIGPTRFLAKLGSETAPKGSVTVVDSQRAEELLLTTAFEDICGVGPRLARRLRGAGIESLYGLYFVSDEWLISVVGKAWARQLRQMVSGEEPDFLARLDTNAYMKSVGRSITGWATTTSISLTKRILTNLTTEVCHKARTMNLAGRHYGVYLQGSKPDQVWKAEATLTHPTNHTQEFTDWIWNQLASFWVQPFPIIRYHVRLSKLKPLTPAQPQLLPEWQRQHRLHQAIDTLSHRYGLYTVHTATMHAPTLIEPEVTGFLGDKQYQFNYT